LLMDAMNQSGEKTILVREPGGTIISEEIREILLHRHLEDICDRTEALLMTGSRAQLTYEVIQPNLTAGINVIADRFTDSTLAYQGGGRNIDLGEIGLNERELICKRRFAMPILNWEINSMKGLF